MPAEVEVYSATWCKRCKELKPEIETVCIAAGATLKYIDATDWDDDAIEAANIRSLPTLRTRIGSDQPWVDYIAATFAAWKEAILATASVAPTEDF